MASNIYFRLVFLIGTTLFGVVLTQMPVAAALLRGNPLSTIPTAPVLKNATIPFAEFTRLANGGAPLDNIILTNGTAAPVDHYVISETQNSGYWRMTPNALDSSPGYTTLSNSPQTISNVASLVTPIVVPGAHGTNYSSSRPGQTFVATTSIPSGGGCNGTTISITGSTWSGDNIQVGQTLFSFTGGKIYPLKIAIAAYGTTDPCTGSASTGTGQFGTYVLSTNAGFTGTVDTLFGDVLCGSDGGVLMDSEDGLLPDGTPNGLTKIKGLVQGSTPVAYAVGNVTLGNGFCPFGWAMTTIGAGANLTATYYGYAESPTPSNAGAAANLGYTKVDQDGTPDSGCGAPPAAHLCGDNLGKYTFSIHAVGANGLTSNTVTLTIDLTVDGNNLGNTIVNRGIVVDSDFGAGSSVGITAMRDACNNCNSGGSSVGDMQTLFSVGAPFSNPNRVVCCGQAQTFTMFSLSYLGALAHSSKAGTLSTQDLWTFEDACRHFGTQIIAPATVSNQAFPGLNSCDSGHGFLASFDQFKMSSVATVDPCDTDDPHTGNSPGISGIYLAGLTNTGDPRDNYDPDTNQGFTPSNACNIWLVSHTSDFSATITSDNQLTDTLSGNTFTTVTFGPNNKHIFSLDLQCYFVARCYTDGSQATSNASTDIQLRQTIVDAYQNDAFDICAANGLKSVVEYHERNFQGPHNTFHADDAEFDPCQGVNSEYDMLWLMPLAGGNITSQCVYGDFAAPPLLPQGLRFNNLGCFANSLTSWKWQGADGLTTRSSTYTNYLAVRQTPQHFGTNVANTRFNLTNTARTIVDGDTLKLSAACSPEPCNASQYVITFKNSVSDPTTQVVVGSDNTHSLYNLSLALGISLTGYDCNGVAPTTMSAAIAAWNLLHGPTLTATVSGTTLTVTAISPNPSLGVGWTVNSTGSPQIISQLTSTESGGILGGRGTYQLSASSGGSATLASFANTWCVKSIPLIATGNNAGTLILASSAPTLSVGFFACTWNSGCSGTDGWANLSPSYEAENDIDQNQSVFFANGKTQAQGPSLSLSGSSNSNPASCSGVQYCGTVTFTNGLTWDGCQPDGGSTYYTAANCQSHLGSVISLNSTNLFVGCDYNNICNPHGYFVGDGTNSIEAQLEAITDAGYNAMTPKARCQVFYNAAKPQSGGPLDLNGNQTSAAAIVDFSGNFNGFSQVPCADMQTGQRYAYPH